MLAESYGRVNRVYRHKAILQRTHMLHLRQLAALNHRTAEVLQRAQLEQQSHVLSRRVPHGGEHVHSGSDTTTCTQIRVSRLRREDALEPCLAHESRAMQSVWSLWMKVAHELRAMHCLEHESNRAMQSDTKVYASTTLDVEGVVSLLSR